MTTAYISTVNANITIILDELCLRTRKSCQFILHLSKWIHWMWQTEMAVMQWNVFKNHEKFDRLCGFAPTELPIFHLSDCNITPSSAFPFSYLHFICTHKQKRRRKTPTERQKYTFQINNIYLWDSCTHTGLTWALFVVSPEHWNIKRERNIIQNH